MKKLHLFVLCLFASLILNAQELPFRMEELTAPDAKFPNHYGGDGTKANAQAGELLIISAVDQLVKMIQAVKEDEMVPALQKEFFDESENPLKTKQ